MSNSYAEIINDPSRGFDKVRDEVLRTRDHCGGLKIYVGKFGQDGHDRGQQVVCEGLSALGFEVVRGALFCTPKELVRDALTHNAHIVGISSLAGGHRMALDVLRILKNIGLGHIPVVVGGVMPPDEAQYLLDNGIRKVFLPGSNILTQIGPELLALGQSSIPEILASHRLNSADLWHDQLVTKSGKNFKRMTFG